MTADDPEVVGIAHQRAFQCAILALDGLELQRAFDQRRHLMKRERLFNVVESTELDGFDRNVERAVRSHDHDFRVRCVAFNKSEEVDAAGIRETQVSEDEIEWS